MKGKALFNAGISLELTIIKLVTSPITGLTLRFPLDFPQSARHPGDIQEEISYKFRQSWLHEF